MGMSMRTTKLLLTATDECLKQSFSLVFGEKKKILFVKDTKLAFQLLAVTLSASLPKSSHCLDVICHKKENHLLL